MGRRVIVCDGAELARLWARIGASESEELTWVPREEESRARPPGFRALQGGLTAEAVTRLDPKEGDEFALISDEAGFVRMAVEAVAEAAPGAPIRAHKRASSAPSQTMTRRPTDAVPRAESSGVGLPSASAGSPRPRGVGPYL